MNTASAMEWVTSKAEVPDSDQIRSSSKFIRCRVISSSAPNGSSSSRMSGVSISARAIATRCCMPPDSVCGNASSNPRRPTSWIRSAVVRAERLELLRPTTSSGSSIFWVTERQGSSVGDWNTKPSECACRAAAGVSPPSAMVPAKGCITSATRRRSVDLPQPLGPMIAANCPAGTCMSTLSSAITGSPRP